MTEKILAILCVFISKVIAATGYSGITLLMAIESACIPLPSELIMPFGGYLVYQGTFKLFWLATAAARWSNATAAGSLWDAANSTGPTASSRAGDILPSS